MIGFRRLMGDVRWAMIDERRQSRRGRRTCERFDIVQLNTKALDTLFSEVA